MSVLVVDSTRTVQISGADICREQHTQRLLTMREPDMGQLTIILIQFFYISWSALPLARAEVSHSKLGKLTEGFKSAFQAYLKKGIHQN